MKINISGTGKFNSNRYSKLDMHGRLIFPRVANDWSASHAYGVAICRQEVLESGAVLEILKNNHHPHIANIVDYERDWVYLEYIDGLILSNKNQWCPAHWKTCFLDEPKNKICFAELESAVSFMHSIGIAHTDITPFNVMVTPAGSIKLIDLLSSMPLTEQYKNLDLWRLSETRQEIIRYHGTNCFKE